MLKPHSRPRKCNMHPCVSTCISFGHFQAAPTQWVGLPARNACPVSSPSQGAFPSPACIWWEAAETNSYPMVIQLWMDLLWTILKMTKRHRWRKIRWAGSEAEDGSELKWKEKHTKSAVHHILWKYLPSNQGYDSHVNLGCFYVSGLPNAT